MEKAKQARTENEAGAELDSIKLAVVSAMSKGTYGMVEGANLANALTGTILDVTDDAEQLTAIRNNENGPTWDVEKNGKVYEISKNGNVEVLTGLILSPKNLTLTIQGDTFEEKTVNARLIGIEGTLSWSESTSKIQITPSADNMSATIKALVEGKETITVTCSNGDTTTCTVTVQEPWDSATVDGLNSMIGTDIKSGSYVAKDKDNNDVGDWQIFYADSENEEVFIISKNVLELGQSIAKSSSSSATDDLIEVYTNGSGDIADGSYGQKWNDAWITACKNTAGGKSTTKNAQTAAYLCDTTKWTRFKTGPANYAVGGPTLKLLVLSLKAKTNGTKDLTDKLTATDIGYNKSLSYQFSIPYTGEGCSFWLASPRDYKLYGNGSGEYMKEMSYSSFVSTDLYDYSVENFGIRPIVSIPLSNVKVKGTQVKIVP